MEVVEYTVVHRSGEWTSITYVPRKRHAQIVHCSGTVDVVPLDVADTLLGYTNNHPDYHVELV